MAARGILIALDYIPARGGIARLLESWTADSETMEWRVFTTTPGLPSERVTRGSLTAILFDASSKGRQWLCQVDERVVVAGHPYLSWQAVALARLSGGRSGCIVYGRELVPRRISHRLALAPLVAVDRVVAISDYTQRQAWQAGARRSHTMVLRPEVAPPWLATESCRRQTGAPLRLVTVSRLTEGYKNFELLLRLCAVLCPLGVVERLTIIGAGHRLDRLREKAVALGVDSIVDLPGHLPDNDVYQVLASSHVGLFASRHSVAEKGFEGFGLVVHELGAAGLPVLVGAAAGAVDAAIEPWAKLLDPDDLWVWVDAVEQLYADEGRRLEMGQAALRWARTFNPGEPASAFARSILGRSIGSVPNGE